MANCWRLRVTFRVSTYEGTRKRNSGVRNTETKETLIQLKSREVLKMATDTKKSKSKGKSSEEIFNGFQMLRNEQRNMANKLTEMELELHEHKIVIDTLKEVDGDRKCFKMIGGVLCERTVKEVLPILIANRDQLSKFIETLNEQLTKKGQELNEYKDKFNIRIRGQDDPSVGEADGDKKARTGNVLVVNPM